MFKNNKFLLVLILVLAFVLRFWKLDMYPAFNADEAALGYNAYSLIKTGKDEHGNAWPIHFQSFNDFKPGGYVYLILPFVAVFGLNEWSVRIPNALLSVVTVYIVYLLTKEIFKENKLKDKFGLIASLLLAISPWHIHFSRGGWEVSTATFLVTLGVYTLLKFINTKEWKFLIFTFISMSFALYTYHAARIIAPLLGIVMVVIYWKDLDIFKNIKKYILYSLVFVVLCIPLVLDFTKGSVASRAAGVGLFADPGPISRIEEQRTEHGDFRSVPARLLHNKLINYGLAFLSNWSEHYHGLFLFLSGDDIQRNKVPETGQLYLFEVVTLVLGLIFLIKELSKSSNSSKLIIFWFVVAPVAAALTFQSPHALRAHNMVIPSVIISALGLVNLVEWLKTKNLKWVTTFVWLIVVWSFARYEHMYWIHMSKEYPFSSQYGVKELVSFINEDKNKDRQIVVTDRYDQPYILYLFYSKYDPKKFQEEHRLTAKDGYGFSTVRDFDRFHFYSIKFEEMIHEYPNSLIIGTPEEIPDESNIVKRIYGTNGYEYFDAVAN